MKVQRKAVFWGLLFWILLALGGSVQADEGGVKQNLKNHYLPVKGK